MNQTTQNHAMQPQTLYLHAETPLRIHLEGPSLRVLAEDQAERLYPLRYIERIQADSNVDWRTDALLACADRGISIQFLDRHGDTRARLLGQCPRPHGLHNHLLALMERPRWQERYRQWCQGRRLQTQRYVATQLGFRYQQARDLEGLAQWAEQRLLQGGADRRITQTLQWLHADYYGFITQQLNQRGITVNGATLLDPIDLARDLTEILQAVLLLVRHQGIKRQAENTPITRRLAAQWFSAKRDYLGYQLERMLILLEAWLNGED